MTARVYVNLLEGISYIISCTRKTMQHIGISPFSDNPIPFSKSCNWSPLTCTIWSCDPPNLTFHICSKRNPCPMVKPYSLVMKHVRKIDIWYIWYMNIWYMVYGMIVYDIWYMVFHISHIIYHISMIFQKCVYHWFPKKAHVPLPCWLTIAGTKKNFTVQHHRDSQPLEPHCWTLPGRRSPTWQVIFGDGMGLMGFRSVNIVVRWPNYWNEPSTRMGFALWQQIGGGCQGPSCTCTELLQNTYFFPTFPNPHVSNIKHKSTPNELWVSLNICEYLLFIFFVLFVWHDVAIFYEKQCLDYPHPDL